MKKKEEKISKKEKTNYSSGLIDSFALGDCKWRRCRQPIKSWGREFVRAGDRGQWPG